MFPVGVVTTAGAALFVDVLGLLIAVWKIALNPDFHAKLSPITHEEIPVLTAATESGTENPTSQ